MSIKIDFVTIFTSDDVTLFFSRFHIAGFHEYHPFNKTNKKPPKIPPDFTPVSFADRNISIPVSALQIGSASGP